MLDTSTIIVVCKKRKQGHFVKKNENLIAFIHFLSVWRHSTSIVLHTPLCLILILLPMYIIKYWCEAITLAVCKQAKGHTILQQVHTVLLLLLCIKHIFYCPPSDNMSVINCRSNAFCCCWYCPSYYLCAYFQGKEICWACMKCNTTNLRSVNQL